MVFALKCPSDNGLHEEMLCWKSPLPRMESRLFRTNPETLTEIVPVLLDSACECSSHPLIETAPNRNKMAHNHISHFHLFSLMLDKAFEKGHHPNFAQWYRKHRYNPYVPTLLYPSMHQMQCVPHNCSSVYPTCDIVIHRLFSALIKSYAADNNKHPY